MIQLRAVTKKYKNNYTKAIIPKEKLQKSSKKKNKSDVLSKKEGYQASGP